MKFYCLALKKHVTIPDSRTKIIIKDTKRGKKRFAKAVYTEKGKNYEVWRILPKK